MRRESGELNPAVKKAIRSRDEEFLNLDEGKKRIYPDSSNIEHFADAITDRLMVVVVAVFNAPTYLEQLIDMILPRQKDTD